MHSTSAPSEIDAVFYDGQTAVAHTACAELRPNGLVLRRAECAPEWIPLETLRLGDRMPGRTVLQHATLMGWRLTLLQEPPADWLRALKRASRPSARKVALWSGAGAAVVGCVAALIIWGGAILEWLAPMVPRKVTDPVGRHIVEAFVAEQRCTGEAGHQALGKLVQTLRPEDGYVEPITLHVADSPVVNAMAAPGGHVIIFSQLIEDADSPDEVAGVLAHELGHVQNRHATEALIRHFGVGLLLQALGGDFGALADTTLVLARTREAEREADAWAVEHLKRANISTAGLSEFFERHADEDSEADDNRVIRTLKSVGTYVSTHPQPSERAALFKSANSATGGNVPALSDAEWKALRAICDKPKAPEK